MLDENKWKQYGFERNEEDILGITLHETNNYNMNARELFNYLNDVNKTSQGCHYLVDDEEIIEVMPLNYGVYHTGKGFDYGNKYTIAIEIVSNINDNKYQMAQDKAVELIKTLMGEYAINYDGIFFHKDFNSIVLCPKTIIKKYGSAKRFCIEELESEE